MLLSEKSEGRPIGVKFAAGHIEEDLEFACFAKPDSEPTNSKRKKSRRVKMRKTK